jgi:thiamine-phosphate pyrophosphorylase
VAEGVDYVTVSPVALTASKPGYGPALGIDGLAALIEVAGDVPVLALGGVQPDTVAGALEAGAHGVAVMGAVMRAETPAKIVTRLLDQLKALS